MEERKRNSMVERWRTDKFSNCSSISQCCLCKNKRFKTTCLAYPEGIPEAILDNIVIHDKTTGDDNGIIFEPKNEKYIGVKFQPLGKRLIQGQDN